MTEPELVSESPIAQETTESEVEERHVIHWFRRGLRLHDNPALVEALKEKKTTTIRCVYILDPWFAGACQASVNKWRFLLQSLEDLDNRLQQLNSRLFVLRGQPAQILPKLFKEWNVTVLSFEKDPEPFGRERDTAICKLANEAGVEIISRSSHTLYSLKKILDCNGGPAPLTYKRFQAILSKVDLPPRPAEVVTIEILNGATTEVGKDHDDKYGIPTLESLGFNTDQLHPTVWMGGETEALSRLERHLERKAWVASFEKPKMSAQSLMPSSTGLTPYLRFGCLSARTYFWKLTLLYRKMKKRKCCPLSLHGLVLWREFFYVVATKNPKFDRMKGNPICLQIPWDKTPQAVAKWAEGKTGFPWIDATMVQLKTEGWIHHLARHAVACFLTRGDLWQSWEEGMKVFEEMSLDLDWTQNAGTWMWLSCSTFFQQFFRTYCPVDFGRRIDPNGDYIRRYLPVLRRLPNNFIFEPWKAPLSVQEAAKCVVGKDYPMPMVNHQEVSYVNIERMKLVYRQLVLQGGPLTKYIRKRQQHVVEPHINEGALLSMKVRQLMLMPRRGEAVQAKRGHSSSSSSEQDHKQQRVSNAMLPAPDTLPHGQAAHSLPHGQTAHSLPHGKPAH